MNNHEQTVFNYYNAYIKATKPVGVVTLQQFFEAIRNPKEEIKEVFNKIRDAEHRGDMKEKQALKEKLYFFTPAVIVKDRRGYSNIEKFNGLLPIDFDHLEENYARQFKEYLFNEYEFIIAAWTSPSRHGVRALVNIPVVTSTDHYKRIFDGLAHYCLGQYKGWDNAPKNAVLPLFLSWDNNILIRDNYSVWEREYVAPKPVPIQSYKYEPQEDYVIHKMRVAIDKIVDNGHPQLRSAAFSLGGYVGSGKISYDAALTAIERLIDGNAYLSQKAPIYKRTAREMILSGMNKPL